MGSLEAGVGSLCSTNFLLERRRPLVPPPFVSPRANRATEEDQDVTRGKCTSRLSRAVFCPLEINRRAPLASDSSTFARGVRKGSFERKICSVFQVESR